MKSIRVIVVLVLAISAAAGSARADHQGSISGTVTDSAGVPLPDVCVELRGWNWEETTTDGAGQYAFSYLEPGDYLVRFNDCREDRTHVAEWFDDAPTEQDADVVTVPAGQQAIADATLALGGAITGRVSTQDGRPVGGLCVSAQNEDDFAYTSTDASGAYSIGGFRTGTYSVLFGCQLATFTPIPASSDHAVDPNDYVPEWFDDGATIEDATPIAVTQGLPTGPIDAALDFGGSISGLLEAEDGEALWGICATAYNTSGEEYRDTVSYGGGYRIPGLRTGSYKVEFSDCWSYSYESEWYDDASSWYRALPIAVALGVEHPGIDAVLAPRAVPDLAITDLRVKDVPVSTDVADLPGPGHLRDVEIDIGNLGTAAAGGAYLTAWVEMADGSEQHLGNEELSWMPAGGTRSLRYRWDATGSIGDAEVKACLSVWDDAIESNNQASTHHYVVLGGTGVGTRLRAGFAGCGYWQG